MKCLFIEVDGIFNIFLSTKPILSQSVNIFKVPDSLAIAVDALSVDWKVLKGAFAFPPIPILSRVLQKIRETPGLVVALVAPGWPKQSWYPDLLDLIVDYLIALPGTPRLLRQRVGSEMIFHPTPSVYNYHVWSVSGVSSLRQDFLRRLQRECLHPRENQQLRYTRRSGDTSEIGVILGVTVHSRLLILS